MVISDVLDAKFRVALQWGGQPGIGAAAPVMAIVVMANLWVASTLSLLNLKTCQALVVVHVPTKSVTPSSSISSAGAAAQMPPYCELKPTPLVVLYHVP